MPRTPLEAYAFDARFGKRSVFILDPRLYFVRIFPLLTISRYSPLSEMWRFSDIEGPLLKEDRATIFWKRIHCMQFLCYDMCSFMLSLKLHHILIIAFILSRILNTCNENSDDAVYKFLTPRCILQPGNFS